MTCVFLCVQNASGSGGIGILSSLPLADIINGKVPPPEPGVNVANLGTVSVVIATYQRPGALRKAIESVLRQSYPVDEVLVCEDEMTNECCEIIRAFDDRRLRYLPGGHSGLPAVPRNRGIRAANSKWIAFLDDDDTWHEYKLESQLEAAGRYKASFVSSASGLIKAGLHREHGYSVRFLSCSEFLIGNPLVMSSVLVDRALIASGFSENPILRGLEDYHLWLQVSTSVACCALDDPLVCYDDKSSDSIRLLHPSRRSAVEELCLVLICFLGEHPNSPSIPVVLRLAVLRRIIAASFNLLSASVKLFTGRVRLMLARTGSFAG